VDKAYIFEGVLVNNTGLTVSCTIQLNQADWAVNRQYSKASGTTLSANKDTDNIFPAVKTGHNSSFLFYFPAARTGYERHAFAEEARGTSLAELYSFRSHYHITTPAKTVNITAIGLKASVTNGLDAGTVLRLWKKVA